MVKAKVAWAPIIGNIFSTEADNPSQHLYIITSTDIYKKAFHFSAVVITFDKNRSDKQTALSQK